MSLLVVGSIALDTVETPFGRAEDALGGSATFFAAAASSFCPVQVVGVVGADFPQEGLDFLASRDADLAGVERAEGESFRWSGVYSYDLNSRETLETRLGVFADFQPRIPESFKGTEWVFLGNIDPELQLDVLEQIDRPRLVACDTMNFWIGGKRDALLTLLKKVAEPPSASSARPKGVSTVSSAMLPTTSRDIGSDRRWRLRRRRALRDPSARAPRRRGWRGRWR